MVFYVYIIFSSLWMVGLYQYVVPQLALLIITNIALLVYLLAVRPHLNKINLLFTLLFVLTLITLESFQIYFIQVDAVMFASEKTRVASPFVITLCVVLILLVFWALWRVVWEVSFFIKNFKGTLLYLEFVDHSYEGEKEESEKFSEYGKLAHKSEAGVGDVVVDRVM